MPIRFVLAVPILVAALMVSSASRAEIGVIDNVPAATLLLPHFIVDVDNPQGITTIFSINNASPSSNLVQVTLWTDLGVPSFAFNVYLTGYDVTTVNLRDVFAGILPLTASVGQDPNDIISPHGPISQDINFASCNGVLPYSALSNDQITALRNAHTGQASELFNGSCGGIDMGDNLARGYLTMDSVTACSPLFSDFFPGSAGYFVSGGQGFARNNNELWGDFALIDPANNFAGGEALVAIEADAALGTPGTHTFYRRLVNADASDNREPLATRWAAPFEVGNTKTTNLLVWRDPTVPVNAFTCGTLPNSYPLGHEGLVAFDTEENLALPAPDPSNGLFPFHWASEWVTVGNAELPVLSRSGWLDINTNTTAAGTPNPDGLAQSYILVSRSELGIFSGMHPAIALQSALQPVSNTIINERTQGGQP